jgi:hypothetical protein
MPCWPRTFTTPDDGGPSGPWARPWTRGRPLALFALAALASLAGCGDESGSGTLSDRPVLLQPVAGATVDSDRPVFVVRNAQGFDSGQATYTFRVSVASSDRDVASVTALAGRGETAVQSPAPLLRGALLAWSVVARSPGGSEVASDRATFRLPPVDCRPTSTPYAKSVAGFWVPATCRERNIYNDPQAALGAPDAGGKGPDMYYGFVSLGNGGWVDVDMEGCALDGTGDDVRVFQSVSREPVTLLASSSPTGPWVLVEYRKPCGARVPDVFSRACTFDLAQAGIEEARYFRVQDGELYPCPGGTVTEGADIDAIEILNAKP